MGRGGAFWAIWGSVHDREAGAGMGKISTKRYKKKKKIPDFGFPEFSISLLLEPKQGSKFGFISGHKLLFMTIRDKDKKTKGNK